ncbi:MAG: hypothetical protein H6636_02545 [Anaerolineales bacterium]|nr:hypothetical protein [Anaerolineales bacterium]
MEPKSFFARILPSVVIFSVFSFLLITLVPSALAKETEITYTTEYITEGYPKALNQNGEIVGYQNLKEGKLAWYYSPQTGVVNLPLPDGYMYAEAIDINDSGTIIGNTYKELESAPEAIMWTLSEQKGDYQPHILDTLSIGYGSQVVAINSYNQIVGLSLLGEQSSIAYLYDNGIVYNLNDYGFVVPPTDISDAGIIIGNSFWMDTTTFEVFIIGLPEISGARYISSHLTAITAQNQAIGYAEQDNGIMNLVLFSPENGWEIVGDINDNSLGYQINGANDQLRAIANACPENNKGDLSPIIYREGMGNICLANLLNQKVGNWALNMAEGNGLNAQGQIVIAATNLEKGLTGTLLFSPVIR